MPETIESIVPLSSGLEYYNILLRLLLAVLCGTVIAVVYRFSHGREKYQDNQAMFATLVLLCVFIAMVSMVIGNSVAMAFSLVGALSIVRFRTVVEDTRDTAFVIFTVITGMAMGSGFFAVPLIGIPIASAVAIGLDQWNRSRVGAQSKAVGLRGDAPMTLFLRVGIGKDIHAIVDRTASYFSEMQFLSSSTTKQGSAIEIVYRVKLSPSTDPIDFVSTTNLLDGVQSVELKSTI
jgi:uncharacterized membrane protein YhiD involved in acid resistance